MTVISSCRKLLILATIFVFSGCAHYYPFKELEGNVEYSYSNDALNIISVKTNFEGDKEMMEAFIDSYKDAFIKVIKEPPFLIHWERNRIGKAAELGHSLGYMHAHEYLERQKK